MTPGAASILWIEADPVFGGSESQVQFPKELAPYFRLPANPVIGDYRYRAVIHSGVLFPAKKMDFHHNDVWRLNLPTANQGLGGYVGKILAFSRTSRPDSYDLWLVQVGSPIARKLRSTARSGGELGSRPREDGTERTFGYF